jgi:hypothetical protein
MNDNRSIDLFIEEQVNDKHDTTHVHAYLRFVPSGYVLFVAPYRDLGGSVRGYPLGATEWKRVAEAPRFNAKRLAALAADPATLDLARSLLVGA